jgi:hypothetical protein
MYLKTVVYASGADERFSEMKKSPLKGGLLRLSAAR